MGGTPESTPPTAARMATGTQRDRNEWSGPGGPEKEPPRTGVDVLRTLASLLLEYRDALERSIQNSIARRATPGVAADERSWDRLRQAIRESDAAEAANAAAHRALSRYIEANRSAIQAAINAPTRTPEPVNAKLLAACRAWAAFADELERNSDPSDPLVAIRERTHGARIAMTRAAIADAEKAGGAA